MPQAMRTAVADHHLGLARENRLHEEPDVGRPVLVVRVGVDDDIGAELECRVETDRKGAREAEIHGEPEEVRGTRPARDTGRPVGRAVVDDERLDAREARQGAREGRQRGGEVILLIEARNLDDELHGPV